MRSKGASVGSEDTVVSGIMEKNERKKNMAKIIMFMADGCEEVEALMTVDLIRRAGLEISMVSVSGNQMINGSHGIVMKADEMFESADYSDCEMLILPGGLVGTNNLKAHKGVNEKLAEFNQAGKMVAAICAAPTALAAAGVMKGKKATCYPGMSDGLTENGCAYEDVPVVVSENSITGRSLGAAVDFASAIITHFSGEEAAEKVKKAIVVY